MCGTFSSKPCRDPEWLRRELEKPVKLPRKAILRQGTGAGLGTAAWRRILMSEEDRIKGAGVTDVARMLAAIGKRVRTATPGQGSRVPLGTAAKLLLPVFEAAGKSWSLREMGDLSVGAQLLTQVLLAVAEGPDSADLLTKLMEISMEMGDEITEVR
jgi:hypothetical protein